jgi:hypothetical protein
MHKIKNFKIRSTSGQVPALVFFRDRPMGGSRPAKGSFPMHDEESDNGIYVNPRFLHACATLVGSPVSVSRPCHNFKA